MTFFDISVPLGLGIVSSLHCAQMCGPIVLAYSMGGRSSAAGHLSYNAGRIATYALLGALAGTAGQMVGIAGRLAGIQHTAAIVAGSLMVIAGIVMSGAVPRRALVQLDRGGVRSFLSRTIGKLISGPGAIRKLELGLLMGFLPCGLLYAALLKAASTGSALSGATSMAAFGAGTAGALLGIGLFSSALNLRLGRWSNVLASASVVAVGAILVWRGLVAPPPGMSCHAGM